MATFTAYIFREDHGRLTEEYRGTEGGSLYGQWTSTGNPVVHVAFSRSLPKRQGMTKYLSDSFKLCHIGEWRPVLAGQNYSSGNEYREREALLSKFSGRETPSRFLVLDVNRAKIIPFLFDKRTPRGQGTLEILSGVNPFNRALINPHSTASRHPPPHQPAAAAIAQQNPRNYRSQASQEADIAPFQWYSGERGNKDLQHVLQAFQEIARPAQVEMSRDTRNQNISMSFTNQRSGKKWEVTFPFNFPRQGALLIETGQARVLGTERRHPRQPGSDSLQNAVDEMIRIITTSRA